MYIEKLFKRKGWLKLHLETPLLKEREAFIESMFKRKVTKNTLVHTVNYIRRVVLILGLTDSDNRKITAIEIFDGAKKWAKDSSQHGTKRSATSDGPMKEFFTQAFNFLSSCGRIDDSFGDLNIINQLFDKPVFRAQYLAYPLLKERIAFLQHAKENGYCRAIIRKIARYQLHAIDILEIKELRQIGWDEFESAADKFFAQKSNHRSNLRKVNFIWLAGKWLIWMNMLSPMKDTYPGHSEVDEYLRWMLIDKGCSEITIRDTRFVCKQFMMYVNSLNKTLMSLKMTDIDNYVVTLRNNGWSRASTNNNVKIVRSFLRYAALTEKCSDKLALGIFTRRQYKQTSLPYYAPWDTVLQLLKNTHGDTPIAIRNYAIILLIAAYMLRAIEITRLTLDDVNWRNGTITISHAKNGKCQVYPMTEKIANALIKYLKEVRPNQMNRRELFLHAMAPYKRLSSSAVSRVVRKAYEGVDVDIAHKGSHSIRHSGATHLINNGTPLKEVADMLGHRSIESTMIYAKVNISSLSVVAENNWEDLL
jgi:site-specific recombinase XerD